MENKIATHSSILGLRHAWREEPGRLVHGVAELATTEHKTHTRL